MQGISVLLHLCIYTSFLNIHITHNTMHKHMNIPDEPMLLRVLLLSWYQMSARVIWFSICFVIVRHLCIFMRRTGQCYSKWYTVLKGWWWRDVKDKEMKRELQPCALFRSALPFSPLHSPVYITTPFDYVVAFLLDISCTRVPRYNMWDISWFLYDKSLDHDINGEDYVCTFSKEEMCFTSSRRSLFSEYIKGSLFPA